MPNRRTVDLVLAGWLPLVLYIPIDLLTGGRGNPVGLGLIGFLSPASFVLQTLSKFAGALVIWGILRHRASRTCGV